LPTAYHSIGEGSLPSHANLNLCGGARRVWTARHTFTSNWLAVVVAVGSGLANIMATSLYNMANAVGPTATVSALSAAYPAVTLVLARIFLKEKITANSAIGMALTLAGAVCFALPSKSK
jgi:drug/metabolite transporter (DMT)-like permease